MAVSVILPFAGECGHRRRALAWVLARHATRHPDWELIAAVASLPWCKAVAIDRGVQRAHGDVLVICDADVWCDGLDAAVAALDTDPWAVPHNKVHRLTADASDAVLAGDEPSDALGLAERPYVGLPGGGITVLPRALWSEVPLDPRFTGWGQEDVSWAVALRTLAGEPWRGDAPLWHLWHPPADRRTRRIGSRDSQSLHRRYVAARRDPARMGALVTEAKELLHGPHAADDPDRHGHAAGAG